MKSTGLGAGLPLGRGTAVPIADPGRDLDPIAEDVQGRIVVNDRGQGHLQRNAHCPIAVGDQGRLAVGVPGHRLKRDPGLLADRGRCLLIVAMKRLMA